MNDSTIGLDQGSRSTLFILDRCPMDLNSVLTAVDSWPVDDRLRLMEEIWDRLADEDYQPEITDELRSKLDRRLDALDANPTNVTTWEAIKEHARRPR
jgi:putative addiction module component (TIGR02574 family)